jgi:hypothetical protein
MDCACRLADGRHARHLSHRREQQNRPESEREETMSGTTLQTTEITLLVLLLSVAAIGVLARKLHTPYSILLVIAGLLFSFFPAMPRVTLNPDVVFFVIWLETKINRFSATC